MDSLFADARLDPARLLLNARLREKQSDLAIEVMGEIGALMRYGERNKTVNCSFFAAQYRQ